MNGWKRIESEKNRYYKYRGNYKFDVIDIFPSSKNTDNNRFYVVCATVDIRYADETDYDEAMGYLESTYDQDDEGWKFQIVVLSVRGSKKRDMIPKEEV